MTSSTAPIYEAIIDRSTVASAKSSALIMKMLGSAQQRIVPGVIGKLLRPHGLRIDPWHRRADRHSERDCEIAEPGDGQPAEKAAEDELGSGDRGRADHRREPASVVADDRIGDKRGDDEQIEESEDAGGDRDGIRRVLMDRAGGADTDVLAGGEAEAEQEEDGDRDPKDRVPELIADLESARCREACAVPRSGCAAKRGKGGEVDVLQPALDRLEPSRLGVGQDMDDGVAGEQPGRDHLMLRLIIVRARHGRSSSSRPCRGSRR